MIMSSAAARKARQRERNGYAKCHKRTFLELCANNVEFDVDIAARGM